MSFSRNVKEELAKQYSPGRHCAIAEFSALFNICGRIKEDRFGETYLMIRTENLTVAQKSYILLNRAFEAETDIMVRNHNVKSSGMHYSLLVRKKSDVLQILKALKVIDDQGNILGASLRIQWRLVQNTCCKRAFLRGSFLAAGSITDPKKAYHLELALQDEKYAKEIQKLVANFGPTMKLVERKKNHVLYLKEGSQIVDFLNVIEAHVALMELENVRILKEVRNSVNRQVNCETANIGKTVAAAARQVEDIRYIQCNMGFSQLTSGLREIAELRLEFPDLSLSELGQMLERPISKSGVNHRLRKISKIAEQLREKNGESVP